MLVAGLGPDAARAAAVEKLEMPAALAEAAVLEAQAAIVLASHVDRRRELGMSIKRLADLYTRALRNGDHPGGTAEPRTLGSSLLDLVNTQTLTEAEAEGGETPEAEELAAIAAHLRPLKLGPDDYPLPEVARLAALVVQRSAT